MDENTRFLIERMDDHYKDLRTELDRLQDKIDGLVGFKNRILGAAMVVGAISSVIVELIVKLMRG